MACNCGSKRMSSSSQTFVATFADGRTQTYSSKIEAAAAVLRNGGSYRPAA